MPATGTDRATNDPNVVSVARSGPVRWWLPVRHAVPVAVAAVLGLALSYAGWAVVAAWGDRAAEAEFRSRSNNVGLALQHGLDEYVNKVGALRALFESSSEVTRRDFDVFSRRMLEGQSAILSLSWIPRILSDQRTAHEQAAVGDGFPGYGIKAVAADRSLVPAPDKDEYFPVSFTTERELNGPVLGLDLADGGMRQRTIERARDGDRLAASDVLTLQSGIGDRRGFFVVLPVYRQDLPHRTIDERRENLAGFVQGVFQTRVMVEAILGAIRTPVDLYVFPPGNDPDARPLHVRPSDPRAGTTAEMSPAEVRAGLHWSGELRVADARWILMAVPARGGAGGTRTMAWIVLAAGLLISGIAVVYVWSSGRHALHLVRVNQKVSDLARTDALTSLANRRAFLDRLASCFAEGGQRHSPFAVLYLDLDNFKDVNDTLGHPAGDVLLRQVAERLQGIVRAEDMVARFGGDEFAVLQTDASDLAGLAERIIAALAAPYDIDGNKVHVSASVGIAHDAAEHGGPAAVMMQADLALYRAKEDGRNCFRFHCAEFDREVHERVAIAEDLRDAAVRGEFELHYQPQVDLATGRILGLEALIRWNHPTRGLLSPAMFIPIAERTGSIIEIGGWAIADACRQIRVWEDAGIAPDVVAVNVSAIQFKGSKLESHIADNLARWRVPAGRLEIELTETVLMDVSEQHREALGRLRELGVRIAIDDFGTGYSSLDYLTSYPINRLKIAQNLVFRVISDTRNATVVRAAIRLARELGIDVIAEGVETEEQAEFLAAAGCECAQGFHFSRPLAVAAVTRLLRAKTIGSGVRPAAPRRYSAA